MQIYIILMVYLLASALAESSNNDCLDLQDAADNGGVVMCGFGDASCFWSNEEENSRDWFNPFLSSSTGHARVFLWPNENAVLSTGWICPTSGYYNLTFSYRTFFADACELSVSIHPGHTLWSTSKSSYNSDNAPSPIPISSQNKFKIIFEAKRKRGGNWITRLMILTIVDVYDVQLIFWPPVSSSSSPSLSSSSSKTSMTRTATTTTTATTTPPTSTESASPYTVNPVPPVSVSTRSLESSSNVRISDLNIEDEAEKAANRSGTGLGSGLAVGVSVSVGFVVLLVVVLILVIVRRRTTNRRKSETSDETGAVIVANAAYSLDVGPDNVHLSTSSPDNLFAVVNKPRARAGKVANVASPSVNNEHDDSRDNREAANLYSVAGDHRYHDMTQASAGKARGDNGYELAAVNPSTATYSTPRNTSLKRSKDKDKVKFSHTYNPGIAAPEDEYNKLSHLAPRPSPSDPSDSNNHLPGRTPEIHPSQTESKKNASLASDQNDASSHQPNSAQRRPSQNYVNVNPEPNGHDQEYNTLVFDGSRQPRQAGGKMGGADAGDVYNHLGSGEKAAKTEADEDQYNALDFDSRQQVREKRGEDVYNHLQGQ